MSPAVLHGALVLTDNETIDILRVVGQGLIPQQLIGLLRKPNDLHRNLQILNLVRLDIDSPDQVFAKGGDTSIERSHKKGLPLHDD